MEIHANNVGGSLLRGFLRWQDGDPVEGAKLRFEFNGDKTVRSGNSGKDGFFSVYAIVPTKKRVTRARVIVNSGSRQIYSTFLRIDQQATQQRYLIRLPNRLRRRFRPMTRPLPRLSGGLIDVPAVETIAKAVDSLFSGQPDRCRQITQGVERIVPPLAKVTNILDIANRVLESDSTAVAHLRQTLIGLAITRAVAPGRGAISSLVTAGGRGSGFKPIDPKKGCLFQHDRVSTLYIATLTSAHSQQDRELLASGLDAGLAGSALFDKMYRSARDFLGTGDPSAFRQAIEMIPPPWPPDGSGILPPTPNPEEFLPDIDPCLIHPMECIYEIPRGEPLPAACKPNYVITSISPVKACPGTIVTLTGINFGNSPGKVVFPKCSLTTVVDPLSWTPTQIKAVVPADATPGMVGLLIPEYVWTSCHGTSVSYEPGTGIMFEGGRAWIDYVTVNGAKDGEYVAPNTTLVVAWSACPDPGARVSLQATLHDGSVWGTGTGLPAVGTYSLPPIYSSNEWGLKISITASLTNGCQDRVIEMKCLVGIRPTLKVEGIELTQGIQQFGIGAVNNNSVALVARKDTIARVYVSSDRGGFNQNRTRVTGYLTVTSTTANRMVLSPINGSSPDPSQDLPDPWIEARPVVDIARVVTNHTLNFRIPAGYCIGDLTVEATIFPESSDTSLVTRKSAYALLHARRALPVRYIKVDEGSWPAMTDAAARFTVDRAFDLLPSPPSNIGSAFGGTYDTSLDSGNWAMMWEIVQDLDDMHNFEWYEALGWFGSLDSDDITALQANPGHIWVAVTFNNHGRGMMAWPGGYNTTICCPASISAGSLWYRDVAAHEISHCLGLGHVQATGDESCFAIGCESSPGIGEAFDQVAFDPFWNKTVSQPTYDYMSYASSSWISITHWNRLFGAIGG